MLTSDWNYLIIIIIIRWFRNRLFFYYILYHKFDYYILSGNAILLLTLPPPQLQRPCLSTSPSWTNMANSELSWSRDKFQSIYYFILHWAVFLTIDNYKRTISVSYMLSTCTPQTHPLRKGPLFDNFMFLYISECCVNIREFEYSAGLAFHINIIV